MATATLPPPPKVNGTKPKRQAAGPSGSSLSMRRHEKTVVAPRIILNAVEGWGKTSAGAYAPKPAMLMARDETGYETLASNDLVPLIDTAHVLSWSDLLGIIPDLSGYETVVLDALGGFERLCHEDVCEREFNGDWGERGFSAFQRGYDVSTAEWLKLLNALDVLHRQGITIVLLSHCKIKTFKNPLGADFDRYVSDVHDKTWSLTHKWADVVLFGNFYTSVETNKGGKPESLKKGKGIGGTERVVYTQRRDSFDAKNRFGMETEIDIPDDPSKVWSTIWNQIRKES